ncbi:hypothetical protein Scep_023862 [Stephania cephalantha]|uniref:Uncharacterized protein n=1 Tax=Stephania cephalantha TaxID=152367 RepID=A0AAP0EYD2_9MAGN
MMKKKKLYVAYRISNHHKGSNIYLWQRECETSLPTPATLSHSSDLAAYATDLVKNHLRLRSGHL